MVLKRKLNCGSNGFDFPNIPKAPRSSRRKVASKRADDDDDCQICAFDVLASVAEKLLEESESSSSTYAFEGDNQDHSGIEVKLEHKDDFNKPCKSEFSNQGNPAPKSTSEDASETRLQLSSLENDSILKQTPSFDCKRAQDLNPLENTKGDCDVLVESGGITEETGVVTVDTGFKEEEATNGLVTDTFNLSPGMDGVSSVPSEEYENDYKLVCRDDDDNNCNYCKLSGKCKSYRPLTRIVNRRIKKSAMTKYRRAVPRSKCYEDTRTDGCLKALYRKRKSLYGYNSWKHETVYRKRKMSDKGFMVNSDEGLSCESVSNSPQKGDSGSGVFSTAIGLHSNNSSVKFSIKSLRIPELLIEIPKTATVGSLKRTVKEAVTALLGGGIHIGVLLHGKKVKDDNNTLSQTGLSRRENRGNLDFTLEPGPEELHIPLCSENPIVSMPTDSTKHLERSSASHSLDSRNPLPLQDADHLNNVKKNHEIVPYQSDISANEQPSSDSRALVPVSALETEALTIIPVNEKPKRTEFSQRRTRRPFSVTEVEALVKAVEELGTGRWRDVKLRSFENANHRTYVDLKDKWKTLVHTASISPQQRRGEPVPQVLLDRVLEAHRHWSQHQMKQNGKHQDQVAATMVVQSGLSM